jgi:uncharacterized protein (TIGR02594 family)
MLMRYKKSLQLLWITGMLLMAAGEVAAQTQVWNPGASVGTANGIYSYNYTQTPSALVEIYPAAIPNTGLTYQWYSSISPTTGFTAISGATASGYSPPVLTTASVTTYYYRVVTSSTLGSLTSNTVKIAVVSVNWEDINYVREHNVETIGQTTWTAVDQLPIGSKYQTTNYLDGLGRSIETVSKQTATPASGSTTWGDIVHFSIYDVFGRQPLQYLTYTSTNQLGFYKTSPTTDQAAYYSNASTYSETSPYTSLTFDNSPLNQVMNVKEPGASWAAGAGTLMNYDMNTMADSVQIWGVDYVQGDAPVNLGTYAANTLYKKTTTDVNGNEVVEFVNKTGQVILKKVQAVPTPAIAYTGWICTYYVYDDFGTRRYEIEPEGVKYLVANSWSFAGTNGATVLAEQVFQFNYDDKGRCIWKKTPGAAPVNNIYDPRDRLVFTQDGNQAALSTPQWTANLYDALDRVVLTTLYNTAETIASLQSDITNSITTTTVSTSNASTPVVNLVVDNRNTAVSSYAAQNSITFTPGFAALSGDNFTASISTTAATPATSNTLTTYNNPISSANLNNVSVCSILKYFFYDNYSFATAKVFDNSYTNTNAYSTSNPNVLPIASSRRTWGFQTGAMTLVLGTSLYLSTTNYYDEKGDHIQTLQDNIKSGTDVSTVQYHFDARVLSVCNSHTNVSAGYSAFVTLTMNVYDNLGRLSSTQKQFGSNPMVTVASYAYDDMGRLLTKTLAPGYTNTTTGQSQLESLAYTFNIHNQLTGINKNYALKTSGSYSKWGHYFGQYIGYDNKDNAFAKPQLDGQITGVMWSTQGDDAQRKYDFTYDNAARLINAAFNQQQHPGDGWSNSTMDFSVSGTSGQITYDNNGNLLTLLQKGVIPGQSAPFTIDDLRYAYNSYSNKLQSVTDMMTAPTLNGLAGDFKDGTNAAGTPDYVYDNNGNVVVDLNKNIQSLNNGAAGTAGIHYNFLDKPDQVRIPGKGTILIVYDAEGDKLQRAFVPDAGGSGLLTTYIGQYVYQETATLTTGSVAPFSGTAPHLAYFSFEEGRIRTMTPTSTNNGYDGMSESGNLTLPAAPSGGFNSGAWDYYLLDYQQNVRMILTEETHSATNECTMETTNNRPALEDPVFGQTGSSNEVETTRTTKPTAWTGNTSASVSQLGNLAGHNLGPNSLQKVMAGDMVTASAIYYYAGSSTSSNPNIITNLLASLSSVLGNGPASVGTLVHGEAATVTSNLNGVPGFVSAVEPNSNTTGTPQAYLTILFFDERFNFIAAADGGVAQMQVRSTDAGNPNVAPLVLTNVQAPRNGYAYIYISNRSDQSVYFDNLTINITTGNIAEEDHYYAYGLKIAAISSHKLGDTGEGYLQNNYLYEGTFSETDADIGWEDFDLREYDPQIARWEQQDPYYQCSSPYVGMGADPINGMDPSGGLDVDFGTVGDLTGSVLLDRAIATIGGAMVGFAVDRLSGGTGWTGGAVGAGAGLAATFIPPFSIDMLLGKTSGIVGSAVVHAADIAADVKVDQAVDKDIHQVQAGPDLWVGPPSNTPPLDLKVPVVFPPPPKLSWVENAGTQLGAHETEDEVKVVVKLNKKTNELSIDEDKSSVQGCNCGEDVDTYLKSIGLPSGNQWCAAFVNWDLGQVHMSGSGNKENGPGKALSFLTYGDELKEPAYGSIGVIDHGGGKGHVTIIVGQNAFGDLIGLGGNQGDHVSYSVFPRSAFKSFRYPHGMKPNYNLPYMKKFSPEEQEWINGGMKGKFKAKSKKKVKTT